MPASSRLKALTASADWIRSQELDEAGAIQRMIEDFAQQAAEGEIDYVTPLHLLKAAASRSQRAIRVGLTSVDIDFDSLLSAIETTILAENLTDEPPPPVPPLPEPKYAVVIEGPGFRHDGNRYAFAGEDVDDRKEPEPTPLLAA